MPAKSRRSRYKSRVMSGTNAGAITRPSTVNERVNLELKPVEGPAKSIPAAGVDERGRVLQEIKMIALVTAIVTVLLVVLYLLFR